MKSGIFTHPGMALLESDEKLVADVVHLHDGDDAAGIVKICSTASRQTEYRTSSCDDLRFQYPSLPRLQKCRRENAKSDLRPPPSPLLNGRGSCRLASAESRLARRTAHADWRLSCVAWRPRPSQRGPYRARSVVGQPPGCPPAPPTPSV